jgi:hypothetical protein
LVLNRAPFVNVLTHLDDQLIQADTQSTERNLVHNGYIGGVNTRANINIQVGVTLEFLNVIPGMAS